MGILAMAVDLGYAVLVRSQLQVAADSAVTDAALRMGTSRDRVVQAARLAARGRLASGKSVLVEETDVQVGLWNTRARTFTPSGAGGNAVRVVARRDEPQGRLRPPYLARLLSTTSPEVSASAVAVAASRDIAFVVDLSQAMNDKAQPARGTSRELEDLQRLFDDFGFGEYPGDLEYIGRFADVPSGPFAYAQLTADDGPMTAADVPTEYRIADTDDEPTRKRRCYSALIDLDIARLMPAAEPTPDSRLNYDYWEKYLDYVIHPVRVRRPVNRGWLPPNQDRDRICQRKGCSPETDGSECLGNRIGYRTYLQFMLDSGRDLRPDGRQYTPLSAHSPDCPRQLETTAAGRLSFPPRTEPMHTVRRALIGAIDAVRRRNLELGDPALADRVSIISFDSLTGGGPVVRQPLTADLEAAARACTNLQAVGNRGATSAIDSGLEAARRHLRPKNQGGEGRRTAGKLVVLLTAGPPDTCAAERMEIDRFVSLHPAAQFYPDGPWLRNAPLVSAARMRAQGWRVFSVAVGPQAEDDFVDRLASIGRTDENGAQTAPPPPDSLDPEEKLVETLVRIIRTTEVQLVQ